MREETRAALEREFDLIFGILKGPWSTAANKRAGSKAINGALARMRRIADEELEYLSHKSTEEAR